MVQDQVKSVSSTLAEIRLGVLNCKDEIGLISGACVSQTISSLWLLKLPARSTHRRTAVPRPSLSIQTLDLGSMLLSKCKPALTSVHWQLSRFASLVCNDACWRRLR